MSDMLEIQRTLGRVEQKVDEIRAELPHLEKRLDSLERTRTYFAGMLAAVSAMTYVVSKWMKF